MSVELVIASPRGSITISRDVVAEIVGETAERCYGVVGLAPGSRIDKLLRRDGVTVGGDVADDLRDRLGRHGDPPEVGGAGQMGALVHAARLDDGRWRRVTFALSAEGRARTTG